MTKQITAEQSTNGTMIQETVSLTFESELAALLKKYNLQLVPYIIRFNDGTQLADAKFVPVQK